MSGLQQKYWVFHEIRVSATYTKRAAYKEQATEFFKKANALYTNAAIFDLNKRIFKDMCNWTVTTIIPRFKFQMVEFRSFLEKSCKQHIPDQSTLRKHYLSQGEGTTRKPATATQPQFPRIVISLS
jgi:hypothetical protein